VAASGATRFAGGQASLPEDAAVSGGTAPDAAPGDAYGDADVSGETAPDAGAPDDAYGDAGVSGETAPDAGAPDDAYGDADVSGETAPDAVAPDAAYVDADVSGETAPDASAPHDAYVDAGVLGETAPDASAPHDASADRAAPVYYALAWAAVGGNPGIFAWDGANISRIAVPLFGSVAAYRDRIVYSESASNASSQIVVLTPSGSTRLGDSATVNRTPALSADHVVWVAEDPALPGSGPHPTQIMIWDGTTTRQLTQGNAFHEDPQVWTDPTRATVDGGTGITVVWSELAFTGTGNPALVISDGRVNRVLATQYVERSHRLDHGWVAWAGYPSAGTYVWNGSTVVRVSDANAFALRDGHVAWSTGTGVSIYDGKGTRQIATGIPGAQVLDVSNDKVLLMKNGVLFLWDGTQTSRIASARQDSLAGFVVGTEIYWTDYLSGSWQIRLWDGHTVSNLAQGNWYNLTLDAPSYP
jgi:hypothetical protein